jgi:tetratricopeptide (TPR) repeat protein
VRPMLADDSLCRLLASLAAVALLAAGSGCQMAANGHNTQGARYFQQGQYPAALQQFQLALSQDPTNADAHYNQARTYHQLGKMTGDTNTLHQAEALYNHCLELQPDHVECHRGLAVLLAETDRGDRAFALLQNWAQRSPSRADARVELARLYEEYGDKETARRQLEEAVAIDTTHARAWVALGKMREEQGDYAQALANYQRSLAFNSFQPQVQTRVAALQQGLAGSAYGGGTQLR